MQDGNLVVASKGREKLDSVIARASKLVTPSKSEERKLARVAATVSALLEEKFKEVKSRGGVQPKQSLGGSYAKGTWLKDSGDIDYFLLYPTSFSREQLEGEAIVSIKEALKQFEITMRFAEHPYVEAFVEGVRVNVVPCYEVKRGEWMSAADRSPFHTEYIRSKYDDKLRLEARLFKKFVKGAAVYGAEVKVQGFSGYVCEVLTLKYGSFENVLKCLSTARPGEVISVEEYDRDVAATFTSDLIILDPVDSTRNLGSAISTENVARLVLWSREFLEKPSLSYFEPGKKKKKPEVKLQALANGRKSLLLPRIVVVLFPTEKRSVDILWGQLKKSLKSLSSKINELGFFVVRHSAASNEEDESAFVFLMLDREISKVQAREGPEYFRGNEVRKYIEKNKDRSLLTFTGEEGRLYSLFDRSSSYEVTQVLRALLSDDKRLDKLGLSKAVKDEVSRSFDILTADRIVRSKRLSADRKWLLEAVNSLLSSEGE